MTKVRAKLTADDSLNDDIEKNPGFSYLKINEFHKAAQCFEQALKQAEAIGRWELVPVVMSYLGLALVLAGNYDAGFMQLKKARELYPLEAREKSMEWAVHRFHMGCAYQEAGCFVDAISEYNEALRLSLQRIDRQTDSVNFNSSVGDSYAGLGQCFLALKQYEEAELCLGKALQNYKMLNDSQKIEETASLLKTIPARAEATLRNSAVLENKIKQKRYLQFGLGASLILCGIFAYKSWSGKAEKGAEEVLASNQVAQNSF